MAAAIAAAVATGGLALIPEVAVIAAATGLSEAVVVGILSSVVGGGAAGGAAAVELMIRPQPNIISRPKVFLVKESTRIKIILIASYFFSKIELATIDIHSNHRTI
jgi:hypothetical protein